jgi:hypothetical protein
MSAMHPGFVYLVFHVLVFTFRIYAVIAGAATLFTNWRGSVPVSDAEMAWAANLADIALVAMTAAWIKVAWDDQCKQSASDRPVEADANQAMLSKKVIWVVAALAAPIGVMALLSFGYTPTLGAYKFDMGAWNSSSLSFSAQSWTGLALLSLIYYYGFRKLFVVPMCAYLLVMAVQGYDRFRVMVPLIYLLFVWLSRERRKWPPLWLAGTAVAVSLLFFPMKTIGSMVQKGEPVSDVAEVTLNIISDATSGQSGDQVVMDEFASTVTLVDDSGRYYYGSLYYPLLVMPVPRQWWPDKPALNRYQYELSTQSRPMARAGMVATLHGESYANLGVLGIIIVGYISAYYLGRYYFAALRRNYLSVYRFMYVMVACNFIQIFRDGLMSLVIFTVVNMTPLVAIGILSYVSSRRKQPRKSHPSSFFRGRTRGAVQA